MTTVKCAADLLNHPQFIGFCEWWRTHSHCPMPLGDFLRDEGLEEQAAVADWAYRYPKRPVFNRKRDSEVSHLTPYKWHDGWAWIAQRIPSGLSSRTPEPDSCADELPNCPDEVWLVFRDSHFTFAQAIAFLLDHYRPPEYL